MEVTKVPCGFVAYFTEEEAANITENANVFAALQLQYQETQTEHTAQGQGES